MMILVRKWNVEIAKSAMMENVSRSAVTRSIVSIHNAKMIRVKEWNARPARHVCLAPAMKIAGIRASTALLENVCSRVENAKNAKGTRAFPSALTISGVKTMNASIAIPTRIALARASCVSLDNAPRCV